MAYIPLMKDVQSESSVLLYKDHLWNLAEQKRSIWWFDHLFNPIGGLVEQGVHSDLDMQHRSALLRFISTLRSAHDIKWSLLICYGDGKEAELVILMFLLVYVFHRLPEDAVSVHCKEH